MADSINDVSHENGPAAFILVLHGSHQMNYLANRHMSLQVLRTSMQPCKCGVVFISLPSQQGKGSIGSPLDCPQPWKTLLTPQVHFSNSVLLVQMYQILPDQFPSCEFEFAMFRIFFHGNKKPCSQVHENSCDALFVKIRHQPAIYTHNKHMYSK